MQAMPERGLAMIDIITFEDYLYSKMAISTVEETTRKIRFLEKQTDLTSRDAILEFLREERRNGSTAKRINEHIKILNRWLVFRKEEKIEYLKSHKGFTIKFYDEEEIKTLLKRLGDSTVEDQRNRTMVLIALNTGLRRSEIADLKIEDIHSNSLIVRRGKGDKTRTVFLDQNTKQAISHYLTRRNNPASAYVFTTRTGKITGKYMGKIAGAISEKTGVQFSWHKCRHTYAKTLLRSGVDLETIRIMLGHENLGTTQIYTILGSDEALERISKQDVKFIKVEGGSEPFKPNTFHSGLKGVQGYLPSFGGISLCSRWL